MVSSFVIAEGEQRTPEGYGESAKDPGRIRESSRAVGYFFGFPTTYVGNLLLRQAAEEGGVDSPIPCMRAEWPDCYIRGGHRAPLPVGLNSRAPGAPRALQARRPRVSALKADIGVSMVFISSQDT